MSPSVVSSVSSLTVQTAHPLNLLQPGHWYEVASSSMEQVEKLPGGGYTQAEYDSYQGQEGISAVFDDWNSAAYDTLRNRLLIHGAGHNGYYGNEIYAFNVDTLSWERLTDPKTFPANTVSLQCGTTVESDNTPVGRHTNAGLEYLDTPDQFFMFSGAPNCPEGGCGIAGVWCLDLPNVTTSPPWGWDLRNPPTEPRSHCWDCIAYDNVGDFLYFWSDRWQEIWRYKYSTNTFTQVGSIPSIGLANKTFDIADDQGFAISIGGGSTHKWTLAGSGMTATSLSTNGSALESAGRPGCVYYPPNGTFVGYVDGIFNQSSWPTSVYEFNPATNQYTTHPAAAGNAVTPINVVTNVAYNGTFRRWSYCPDYGVFIFMIRTAGDVYFYKPNF